jgi:hypothetical protein
MRRFFSAPFLALPIAISVGCTKPDLDMSKIRVGMAKKEVLERVGDPSRVTVLNDVEVYEYEAYDRYGAIKINNRSRFIRFADGRVESFGTLEDLKAGRTANPSRDKPTNANSQVRGVAAKGQGTPPTSPALSLRTELEELERLRKEGLISEAEFKDLRQKAIDKARNL